MTEKKEMWNGGKTNITTKEAKIFRQMEDGYDLDDSEIEFRKELVERERLMMDIKRRSNYNYDDFLIKLDNTGYSNHFSNDLYDIYIK